MSAPAPLDEAPWKSGLRSARANLVPGLALQAFALVVVLGYYWHGPTHALLAQLSELRARMGMSFAILSTGLFGGLLPLLYLKSTPATRDQLSWRAGFVYTAFWAYKGIEVSLWYGFLALTLGDSADVGTVTAKTLIDQFIYCPIWAVPSTAVFYFWYQHGCSLARLKADFREPRWYGRRVLPLLCANLGVWLPLVCIIYALPTPLQLPLQNIVLCFYTLLLAHMLNRATRAPSPLPATASAPVGLSS
jgi:hypothetical protein